MKKEGSAARRPPLVSGRGGSKCAASVGPNLLCARCPCRATSIFRALPPKDLQTLCRRKVVNAYKKGHVLFYEENSPMGLFCVASGRIKLVKSGRGGRQAIVRVAASGDAVGYRALFAEEPYGATAEALEDSVLCFIDRNTVASLLQGCPAASRDVLQRLSRDLGNAEKNVLGLVEQPVRARLARLLTDMAEEPGKMTASGLRPELSLTRRNMAEMIGTSPETVSRCLKGLKDDGTIGLQKNVLWVKNYARLSSLAAAKA